MARALHNEHQYVTFTGDTQCWHFESLDSEGVCDE